MFFISCDKIEGKFIEENNSLCGDASLPVPIKKILVEDYTGHKCGNCPRAAEQTEVLLSVFCDHIIPVSVHVGYFAKPATGDKYTEDFRSEAGNFFNDYFGNDNAGLPNGMVNRMAYNNNTILPYTDWSAAIATQLDDAPQVDIRMENNYSLEGRQLKTKITCGFLTDISKTLTLSVFIVEDSITAWQKDYQATPDDIPDYIHRHVLRKNISAIWGDDITGSTNKNSFFIKKYDIKLDEAYNDRHCLVLTFVSYKETKEVLQAEEKLIQ